MAQYDSTANEVSDSIGASRPTSQTLQTAVNNLLSSIGESITVENNLTSVSAVQNSSADVLFMNLGDGERGSADAPIEFSDAGRDNGRAYIFDGEEGIYAQFNTVERVIVGSNGSDQFTVLGDSNTTVDGGAGNDTITTGAGDDSITGGAGDDSISAGAGNDSIYGGSGDDVAVFEGNADQYTIEQDGAITYVINNETGDVNKVVNIETLSFSDGEQAVEVSSDVQALVTLYKQLFSDTDARSQNGDGQADLEGLQYWANRAEEGTSLGKIALSMLNSDEAGNKLEGLDLNTSEGVQAAVELLYTDVLGREAGSISQDELNYWADQAEAGISIEQIAESFLASDELQDQNVAANEWDFLI